MSGSSAILLSSDRGSRSSRGLLSITLGSSAWTLKSPNRTEALPGLLTSIRASSRRSVARVTSLAFTFIRTDGRSPSSAGFRISRISRGSITAWRPLWRRLVGRPAVAVAPFDSGLSGRSTDTVNLVERLGVRFELTVEPGRGPKDPSTPKEPSTGRLPDFRRVPRIPYTEVANFAAGCGPLRLPCAGLVTLSAPGPPANPLVCAPDALLGDGRLAVSPKRDPQPHPHGRRSKKPRSAEGGSKAVGSPPRVVLQRTRCASGSRRNSRIVGRAGSASPVRLWLNPASSAPRGRRDSMPIRLMGSTPKRR